MRLTVILLSSCLWLSVHPALVRQTAQAIPDGLPWWVYALIVPMVGVLGEIIRRFIIAYLKKLDAKRQAAITEKLKLLEAAEAERQRQFELAMARLQGENAATAALTSSILELARSNTTANASLAADRQQATAERAEFRQVLSGNTDGLGKNTGELGQLRQTVESLSTKLDEVKALIGASPDQRTLTQIIADLGDTFQDAVDSFRRSDSSPHLTVLPVPPSADGHLSQEVHAHETPAS